MRDPPISTPKSAWTLTPKWGTSLTELSTPHRKIWDPLETPSGTMRGRKLKFCTHLHRSKYSFQVWKFFRQGTCVGRTYLTVNLGPHHISENTRARKSKFYARLDGAKYSFRVWKFFRQGTCGGRISRKLLELESWNFTHISMGQVLFLGMKIFSPGNVRGAQRP